MNIEFEKLTVWQRDNRIIRSEVSESKCYQLVSHALGFLMKAYFGTKGFKRILYIPVAYVMVCSKFTIQHRKLTEKKKY